jgi:hypothetical protein
MLTTLQNIQENLDSLKVKLTEEEENEIREIAKIADTSKEGDRYPSAVIGTLLADTPPLKE